MKSLDIRIGGLPYSLACEDSQEGHVSQLAAEIDQRARRIRAQVPRAGEAMVLVMTALMLADELYEAREEAGMLHEKLALGLSAIDAHTRRPAEASAETAGAAALVGEHLAEAMHDLADQLEAIAASVERKSA